LVAVNVAGRGELGDEYAGDTTDQLRREYNLSRVIERIASLRVNRCPLIHIEYKVIDWPHIAITQINLLAGANNQSQPIKIVLDPYSTVEG